MPLANSAWKPRPRVELLATRNISIEEATKKLDSFVEKELADIQAVVSDNSIIKIKQLPEALERLRLDWGQHLDGHDGRPADCFVEVFARLEVHLSPYFLGAKLKHGLKKAVMELLLQHNQTLRCVPMTFSKLKPLGKQAALVHESPYVHFLVQFYSIGFAPKPEQWLIGRTGIIQTPRGMSVTIMNLFNGFVARDAGFHYDTKQKSWVDGDGRPLRKDVPVWFAVESVNDAMGFLTFEGALRNQPHLVQAGTSSAIGAGAGGSGKMITKAKGDSEGDGDAAKLEAGGEKRRRKGVADEATADDEVQPRQKKGRIKEEEVAIKTEVDDIATPPAAKEKKDKKAKKRKEDMG